MSVAYSNGGQCSSKNYEAIVDTTTESDDEDVPLVTVVREQLAAPMVPLGGSANDVSPPVIPESVRTSSSNVDDQSSGRVERSQAHCWSCMTLCPLSHAQAYETTDMRRHHVATHVHMFRTQYAQLGLLITNAELANDQTMMARLWHTCFPQCSHIDAAEIPNIAVVGGASGKNHKKRVQRPKDIEEARRVLAESGVDTAVTANLLQCNKCGEVVDNEDAQTHYNQCSKRHKTTKVDV